jgi:2',3'-cyclic-nucleotide 2'-phosphodiesterase (5'-nucleotidase family)
MDKDKTLLLDTGNLLFERHQPSETDIYTRKNTIITDAMNLMAYDGVNLGTNDISPDSRFFEERCGKAAFATLSANARMDKDCDQNPVQKYMIKEVNGIRIGITGVLPDTKKNLLNRNFHIDDPKMALDEIIPELSAKTDYIILLSGFNRQDTTDLVARIPGIDLGLCVDPNRPPTTVIAGNESGKEVPFRIMSITIEGMELGILTLEKDKGRAYLGDAKTVYLDQKTPSDEKLLEISWQFEKWEKETRAEKKKTKIQNQQQLMKNLELTPEEFFNQKTIKE